LLRFPTPVAITALAPKRFTEQAWRLLGLKINKTAPLTEIYTTAQGSVGVPHTIPRIGLATTLVVQEEVGDLRRFAHYGSSLRFAE
jgi:hypothetical protein